MYLKITILIVGLIASGHCEECNDSCPSIPSQYEELGCKPIKEQGKCCPTSFECPDFTAYDKKKCYYKGKTYGDGEGLPDGAAPECSPGCRCTSYGGDASFTCAHVDCPEFFGSGQRGGPECVFQYDLNRCCRKNTVCEPEKVKELARCEFEGKTYKEGERIYPEKDSCYQCICEKGFDASVPVIKNKHCRKYNCGHELYHLNDIRNGCVPVFFGKERCCPIEYRCPEKTDAVNSASLRTAGSTDKQCKFGDLTLYVGQEIQQSNKCLTCKCEVPPMVTCAKTPNC